ncbi:MAG: carboxymuconolactone decarboxylase family protein [Caulobacteraceae bacterium]|nr:carboxymuconolactone decarboxylase family protein [Caulobacteraceae bacterium]
MSSDAAARRRRFNALDPAGFDDDQKSVFAKLSRSTADPLNGIGGMWLRSPKMAAELMRLIGYFAVHPSLPAPLRELAIIVTARHWEAQLEWDIHSRRALEAGVDPKVVAAVGEGGRPPPEHAQEAAVAAFCSELLEDRFVSSATFAAVRGMFDDRQIVDLIATIGSATMSSLFLNIQAPDRPVFRAAPAAT